MKSLKLASPRGAMHDISTEDLGKLGTSLGGNVFLRDSAGYSEARAVWNGTVETEPAVIACPASPAEVRQAVRFCRDHDIAVGVKGGGHNVAGAALVQDGMTISLANMRGVRVDPKNRTARVEGGATLGDVDAVTQDLGLAVPSGFVSETGIAGLCLRGGLGHLMRRFGLTCDNVTAAEVVTADGSLRRTSENENPELLWALRGGGENLGVVTEFQFKLHPLGPDVQLVMPVYPAEEGKVALQVLHELMSAAPDELGIIGFYGYIPDDEEMPEPIRNREVFVFFGCYSGPESAFTSVVRPLQQLGPPLAELGGRMPYTDVQQTLDEEYPDGRRYYWRSLYLDDLTSQMIDTIHAYGTKRPSKLSTLDVWAMGGAVDRLAPDETAFRQRGAKYMLAVEANWTDPMDDAANIAWARDVVAAMKPYTNRGSYLNFGGSRAESTTALEEAYGSNLKRLREIKQRYDPAHLFG